MIKYTYIISASEDLRGTYTKLEGEVLSEYPLPHNKLKEEAINKLNRKYISFGMLYIIDTEYF